MNLAVVVSRAQVGVDAPPVTVEVHISGGLPGTTIVGLPEATVREARERVRAAILNAQLEYPCRRVTISLAPADLPKDGGRYDLAIALGVLAASGQIPSSRLAGCEFLGELALVERCDARVARSLLEVCAYLNGVAPLDPASAAGDVQPEPALPDLADVRGQPQARRALEIAAAGSHNLLLVGPPGTGKTMLATRLAGILPPMGEDEALEAAAIASVAGMPRALDAARFRRRVTRAPHHSASGVALVGGGSVPRPGEISLAHHGVLFLDELTEFDRRVLEVLREPLESGRILISRAARQAEFPARFQLVAAMNPCPCGYAGDPNGRCRCTPDMVERYRGKVSGPLLDRIDLHVDVPRVPQAELRRDATAGEPSAVVRARATAARERMLARAGKPNAQLTNREVERDCRLATRDQALLEQACERLGLSARAYHRVLRAARTIADLAGDDRIATPQLAEALGYRRLDRQRAPEAA